MHSYFSLFSFRYAHRAGPFDSARGERPRRCRCMTAYTNTPFVSSPLSSLCLLLLPVSLCYLLLSSSVLSLCLHSLSYISLISLSHISSHLSFLCSSPFSSSQYDGEPVLQPPCVIEVQTCGQVDVLYNPEKD